MCIAIYQEPGSILTEAELRRGWSANPDGGGFAYFRKDGSVATYRSMHKDAFLSAYERTVDRFPNSPFAVHMRIATSGTVSKRNCHPFRQNALTAWIHNGILPTLPVGKRSDTAVFVEDYLPQLGSLWMDNPALFEIVEEYCTGSKLVGLTAEPKAQERAYIVNEDSGFWQGKVWFSNTSCESIQSRFPNLVALAQSDAPRQEDSELPNCLLCFSDSLSVESSQLGTTEVLVCLDCLTCQGCKEDYLDCYCGSSPKLYSLTEGQYQSLH